MKFGFRTVPFAIPSLLVGIVALLACGFIQASFNIHQAFSNLMNDFQLGLIPLLLLGCTRAIYAFDENSYITVRSMDWSDPNMSLSLWASPKEKERVGANKNADKKPLKWKSKYASLVVCNYGKGTTDGMNEEGLVINLLFLQDAYYGDKNETKDDKPRLAVSGWGQYVLDKFATVAEAVEDLKKQEFTIVTDTIPFLVIENGGHKNEPKKILVHLSISDASGDSAILQYVKVDGKSKLNIYHDRNHKVMTNLQYDRQLEILGKLTDQSQDQERKWNLDKIENFAWDALKRDIKNEEGVKIKEVKEMTPPMNGADIRYIRASFFSDNIEKITEKRVFLKEDTEDTDKTFKEDWSYEEAIARAFSLIRNLSTPLNVKSLDNPFLSSTIWRTVADQKNKRYFLETARTIYPIYVDLPELFKSIGDTTHNLVLFEPPEVKDGERIDLQQDQKDDEKIGKVNKYFQPTQEDWFEFDPPDPNPEPTN